MLMHIERLGIKYVPPVVTKKPPKAKIIRCMLCDLLYNVNNGPCPNCAKTDQRKRLIL